MCNIFFCDPAMLHFNMITLHLSRCEVNERSSHQSRGESHPDRSGMRGNCLISEEF